MFEGKALLIKQNTTKNAINLFNFILFLVKNIYVRRNVQYQKHGIFNNFTKNATLIFELPQIKFNAAKKYV